MKPIERILVSIDTGDLEVAVSLATRLKNHVGGFKLGKEFFTANGPEGVRRVASENEHIFLDLKFHDIPNTVAGAISSARRLGPFMMNVHASGGRAMMEAAVRANLEFNGSKCILIAVTLLTSLSKYDLKQIGISVDLSQQVVRLARLAKDCGMNGIVCSPLEISLLREACGEDFILVVPGVRPTWASGDDQKRVATPSEAISWGADYIVIGRPITSADDPVAAARLIGEELSSA